MYTLYWERLSGAIAPQVIMEEMGVPYDTVWIDMASGAHRQPGYADINPVRRIPALRLPEDTVIGETAAITLVLGERHIQQDIVPQPGDDDRAVFLFWLSAMAANGYPLFTRSWHPEQITFDEAANETVRQRAEADLADFFAMIDRSISGDPYFLPRGYSALDIYLTMLTEWSADRDALFAANPRIAAVCRAVADRPSYRKVMAQHRE
ncbi:glutathione S-transferase family protein [Cucumibacter marinus]|uniref:glutathione S-transferase family protein n=1 Tax=Cucumibacter marinus TaxID=1121252 RepID=UPI00041B6ECB|nr:glutathione S-transferase family protein [Cucumibacter marinus]